MIKRLVKGVRKAHKKKFVRDTLVLQASTIVQSGTYLVTSVLTARHLGPEQLGSWSTSRELYMFMFFMVSMGLTNAAVSTYSRAKGGGDEAKSIEALASMLKLGTIVSVIIMLAGVFVAPPAARHFYPEYPEVGDVTTVLCFSVVSEVLRSLALAIFNGTRQMKRYAAFDMTTNVLRVGLVWGALLVSSTPMSVACAFLVHGILSGMLAITSYAKARSLSSELAPPPFGVVLRAVPTAPLREFFGLSSLLALSKAMNTVVPRLGILFIPALAAEATAGMKAAGSFSVGNVLNLVLAGGIGAIATNVLPTLGHKMGESDVPMEKMGPVLRRLSLTAGALGMGATLISIPIMYVVVNVFYGEAYSDAFGYYWRLASGNLFIGFAVIVEPFYIYTKRMHLHVAQSIVYATLATAGIYSATHVYGPKGAALAGGLCRVFVLCHLVYIWLYFRRAKARRTPSPSTSEG
ncbi:MAG: lipopolysaccharide biosynthesis protein [Planctomycetes bacterium]|nr:lipopolysaccharide biosynthesis protein [Planctomycetota bacterium]